MTGFSSLAASMKLEPAHAVALPAVVANAAGKVGMTEAALIAECFANEALRGYLAGICRDVIENEVAR